ncbi:MAG: hypothetical protein ACRC57_05175 [Sarcina sp.]
MPLNLRYSTTLKGNMIFTGNTLGLSQDTNLNQPGIQGSMGAFTSLNLGNQVGLFPPGTTLNYLENGSQAQLNLPIGSTVVYAELIWGALYAYDYIFTGNPLEPPANKSIVGLINNPVMLNGISVSPDMSTAQEYASIAAGFSTARWYERTADVTSIVQAQGSGAYYVEKVPGLTEPISNYTIRTQHAGWTLAVIYANPAETYKTAYLYVGAQGINSGDGPQDILVSEFETLPTGSINGKLFLSAQEGDGDIANDQILFGPNVGSLNILSGPNNSATNFFGGQINNSNGNLDTTGTFGNRNNNVFTNTNFLGGRHGWDITAIDISPYLNNSQTSAIIRMQTTGDAYMINASGFVTDTVLLDINLVKAVNLPIADIGDSLTYTFNITNNSNVGISSVNLVDLIPSATIFNAGSLTIDGSPTAFNPNNIIVPDLGIGQSVIVQFSVTVTSVPTVNPISNTGSLTYSYGGVTSPTIISNPANTQVNTAVISSIKSVDLEYAQPGERITYSTILTNTGTVDAENIIFTDAIPIGTIFVANSLYISGVQQIGINPTSGVSIPTIVSGDSILITFQVDIVNTIPPQNPILNTNTTTYEYLVDPLNPLVIATPEVSNTIQTQVNIAELRVVKSVDKSTAGFNDVLTYTTIITNIGNVSADATIFTDLIPAGTTFIPESVKVDNLTQVGVNPASNINLGNISAGQSVIITFEVTVDSNFPPQNPIPNTSSVVYEYIVDPGNSPVQATPVVSNIALTQINDILLDVDKGVDLAYADITDTLLYTIVIRNLGNIDAINTLFQDNIPVGTTFVVDSLTLDGIAQLGADPEVGFIIPNIPTIGQVTITFEVTVDSTLPITTQVDNFATITGAGKTPFNTNTVITEIKHAQLEVVKVVDKSLATINQIITYTSTITNLGNTIATGVVFTDILPTNTTFVVDSVIIGGVPTLGVNPELGISLIDIPVGVSIVISFEAQISNTIPSPNPILNTSLVDYQYEVNPLNPLVLAPQSESNQVSTEVKLAVINQIKSVDKNFAMWGDTLLYTINISNSGNTDAQNIILFDLIPSGTTFVLDSVIIDGFPALGENPALGITLANIAAAGNVIISFEVTVNNSTPGQNPIENQSIISYEYIVDPIDQPIIASPNQSNIVDTFVNTANLISIKSASANVVYLGDTFTYQVVITNTGNIDATSVILNDLVPSGTSFVAGSVVIDGASVPLADPTVGISILDIPPLASVIVEFDVLVDAVIPAPNPMQNFASIVYSHIVNPIDPPVNKQNQSNTINTLVVDAGNFASFNIIKSVNENYALLGDILKYTINFTNTGTTEAINTVLTDIIPLGTTFVSNSVLVNSLPQIGADPLSGINIGTVAINESVIVEFEIKVGDILPIPNPIPNDASINYSFRTNPNLAPINGPTIVSNEVETFIKDVKVSTIKAVNLNYVNFGDFITYTIGISNPGNTVLNNVVLTDIVPNGTTFVPSSVVIGGIPNLIANPESGINIGTLNPSQVVLIQFNVLIGLTFPNPNPILNDAQINYNYFLDPGNPAITAPTYTTNQVTTQVNRAIVNIVKSVDKDFADLQEIVTYTLSVTNSGNVDAQNVNVIDSIPIGTSFVNGSVIVDGVTNLLANPQTGIIIPTISVGQTISVNFEIQIGNILPNINPIENFATGSFEYKVNPNASSISEQIPPSNTVYTKINHGELSIQKAVNKLFVDLGEEITYTFTVVSVGNIDCDDVVLVDIVPLGTNFVSGSVIIDGILKPLEDPNLGIVLGTISVTPIIVQFKILVGNIIPTGNIISNTGQGNYKYLVNPLGNPIMASKESNIVQTLVQHANLSSTKAVNNQFAGINGIITYTTIITNTGNVEAINVKFLDDIPLGTIFINNSLKINGVTQLGKNPDIGVALQNIDAGVSVVVSFNVQVNGAIPIQNPILNTSITEYEYIVDPAMPNVIAQPVNSNQVSTLVNNAQLDSVKMVDKLYSDLGETLKYTITLTNIGNTQATDVILVDAIPIGTTFVTNSVIIDGLVIIGANPNIGITIPNILPATSVVLEFEVLVNSNIIPSPNPINNTAIANYKFKIDPIGLSIAGNPTITNNTQVLVNNAILNLTKSVDENYKDIDDLITYNIEIFNNGNVSANNVIFTDVLQIENVFVQGSVYVDGVSFSGYNPEIGFNLGSIPAQGTVIVEFKAMVVAIPSNNQILNTANTSYTHIVNPNESEVDKNSNSNTTVVNIVTGQILQENFVKSANKTLVTAHDIVKYRVEMTNSGNQVINNVTLKDILPLGTSFIEGSVVINGSPSPIQDPTLEVNIGSINEGETVYVTFDVEVTDNAPDKLTNTATVDYEYTVNPQELPKEKSQISNEVIIDVLIPKVTLEKSSNIEIATVGDVITYTLIAKNIGEINVFDIIVKDLLEEDIDFVEGSVKIDGSPYILASILTGVNIGKLDIGKEKKITFDAKVISKTNNFIDNISTAIYKYQLEPNNIIRINEVNSNLNRIELEKYELFIEKLADKDLVSLNDIITYSVKLTNKGNVEVVNIIFKDDLPDNLEFVENSMSVNGIIVNDVSLNIGVNVGSLMPGYDTIIVYQAKVISGSPTGYSINSAYADFNYKLSNNVTGEARTQKVESIVAVAISSFKQLGIDKDFYLSPKDLDIEEIDEVNVEIDVVDSYVVKVMESTSYEGQSLSGNKLIVHGVMKVSLEYTALVTTQTMNSSYWKVPFSGFVMLPNSYNGEEIEVSNIVENVDSEKLSNRSISVGTMILLVAVIKC